MHAKCGYTFDQDGTIAALTPNEVQRLWRGLALWNEEIENGEEGSTNEHKKATAADKRRFNELTAESGSGTGGAGSAS